MHSSEQAEACVTNIQQIPAAGPVKFKEDWAPMFALLQAKPKPVLDVFRQQQCITVSRKTFPLKNFLKQIGFEASADGVYVFLPTEEMTCAHAVAELAEMTAFWGWQMDVRDE